MKSGFIFKLCVAVFFCMIQTIFPLSAKESQTSVDVKVCKHYINLQDLVINEDGMFLLTKRGDLIEITSLHHDESGYFAKGAKCDYGHDITCWMCYGCSKFNYSCPDRCTCIPWD